MQSCVSLTGFSLKICFYLKNKIANIKTNSQRNIAKKSLSSFFDVCHLFQFCTSHTVCTTKSVSRSFRTDRLKRELQMVHLSDTRCSCIAILWASSVSFAAITLCVASQRVLTVVYLVMIQARNFLIRPRICYLIPSFLFLKSVYSRSVTLCFGRFGNLQITEETNKYKTEAEFLYRSTYEKKVDRSVKSIVTGWTTGFRFPARTGFHIFTSIFRLTLGSMQLCNQFLGLIFLGVKQPELITAHYL
jgi:hypothetical protein